MNTSQPFDMKRLQGNLSESRKYQKPIDKGSITELQPDLPLPEVKSVIEQESYEMIHKIGYRAALNDALMFTLRHQASDCNPKLFLKLFCEWIEEQRKSLTN